LNQTAEIGADGAACEGAPPAMRGQSRPRPRGNWQEKGPEQRFRAPAQFETSLKGEESEVEPSSGGRGDGKEEI